MFVVFVLALSQDCILIMYLHCFGLASLMYIDALMFMLMQCTYMTGKHLIYHPFTLNSPDSFLFLISQCNRSLFFVSLVFCVIMTRILRLRFFSRSRKLPRCHALREPLSPSPLMTPWPGRNSRSGVRASLNTFCSSSLCSV